MNQPNCRIMRNKRKLSTSLKQFFFFNLLIVLNGFKIPETLKLLLTKILTALKVELQKYDQEINDIRYFTALFLSWLRLLTSHAFFLHIYQHVHCIIKY